MLDGVRAATPMGRLGTSEEIAGVIVFLSSDEHASSRAKPLKSMAAST
jgi:NAD(P)-dependent dehydrogenase (short-subunit alcohol dehydrogenase family)